MEALAIFFFLTFALVLNFKASHAAVAVRSFDLVWVGVLSGAVFFSTISERSVHDRNVVGLFYAWIYVLTWFSGRAFKSSLTQAQHANLRASPNKHALEPLMVGIVMVCLISTAMGFTQWVGGSEDANLFGIPITEGAAGARAMANLGQPNLLALVLSFAMFASLWLLEERQISKTTAWVLALIFALAIGLTQSRAIFLGLICATFYVLLKKDLKGAKPLLVVASTLAIGIGSSMVVLNDLLFDGAGTRQLLDSASASARLHAWQLFLESVVRHPWSAEGIAGTLNRYVEIMATTRLGTTVFFSYAHNLVIDLMLWFSAPLGILLTISFAMIFWQSGTHAKESDRLLMCIPLVFAVHSMLELPYAYFSISVIPLFILGYLQPNAPSRRTITIRGWQMLVPVLLTAALATAIAWDYQKIYRGHLAVQLEKRFATPPSLDELEPHFFVMQTWGNIFKFTRLPLEESCEFLNRLESPEHMLFLHPSEYLVQKFVMCLSTINSKKHRVDWHGIEALYQQRTGKP